MSLKTREYTCEHCGEKFRRRVEGKRTYRFCSHHCGNLARRKVTAEILQPLASSGARNYQIAAALKIHKTAVLPALKRFGLYRIWCERRYKKCASQIVGSLAAIEGAT